MSIGVKSLLATGAGREHSQAVSTFLTPAVFMDWPDEPASQQQVMHLKNLGVAVTPNLTMTAAARLIRQLRQAGPVVSKPLVSSMGKAIESRHDSQPLTSPSPGATRALTPAPPARETAAEPVVTKANRVEFWVDTCRDIREMRVASVKVYEFHHTYGHLLLAPTSEQAGEILDALDAAIPAWEKDHPELFYKTLELNYPNLVRPLQAEARHASF